MSSDVRDQQEQAARNQRFREGLALHEIESNPLTSDEISMFEMFEREGWSHERRRAYIIAQDLPDSGAALAAE